MRPMRYVDPILLSSMANKQITVWLNGGPGCSSLAGIMLENGPFLWQPGTYRPVRNPYSWNNLTNMVYIDQPAGTGFSLGPSTVVSEFDVARQFMDFWRRFMKTFDLQNRKIYLTGESYAGQYIPYIASQMLDQDDDKYFRVAGIQINDPYINEVPVLQDGMVPLPQAIIYSINFECSACCCDRQSAPLPFPLQ